VNTNTERKGKKQTYNKDLGRTNPKPPKHAHNLAK
jgi:hypothetical protein